LILVLAPDDFTACGRDGQFIHIYPRSSSDMPLWSHLWLDAERQIAWTKGELEHTPND
jgi:hypothetical protein